MKRSLITMCMLIAGVAAAQTFQVQNNVWPWHDRVNEWQLVGVPKSLASDDPLPQQSCGSRGLIFPKGLKAAVVAMSATDAARLVKKLKLPLRQTNLAVTIQSPDGKKRLPYPVFVYPNPPEKLDSKGNARAGLLLLKLSDEGIESHPYTFPAPPAAPAKSLAERSQFHLYLLVGQSNMAGRGKIEALDLAINPRVLSLNKEGRWVVAMDPLHTDKPSIAGVGLGTTFGKTMAAASPNVVIGLIPCAVGGTTVSQWQKDAEPVGDWGKLYENAIERAKLAQHDGVLKGILWHQGEGDCSTGNIAAYQERLTKVVVNFRTDLAAPGAPFVAGTLGVWDPERHAKRKAFNENLAALPTWFAKGAVADASGLAHKGDGTHFGGAGLRELGRRYAKAMQELLR